MARNIVQEHQTCDRGGGGDDFKESKRESLFSFFLKLNRVGHICAKYSTRTSGMREKERELILMPVSDVGFIRRKH